MNGQIETTTTPRQQDRDNPWNKSTENIGRVASDEGGKY